MDRIESDTAEYEIGSSVHSNDNQPEIGFGVDTAQKADEIDAVVAAFAALSGVPDSENLSGDEDADEEAASIPLPKASENFPFGAKERPARRQFGIEIWCKNLIHNKASWTNAGPILVFALLLFSMAFVIAERPYVMLLNGEPIAYVQKKEDGQKLLEQVSLEVSSSFPAESNVRQYAVITYGQEGVKNKTKPTDNNTILNRFRSDIVWFIDGWTISVNNERTVFLPTRAIAEEVLENVKKSYLSDEDASAVNSAAFVEPVELLKEEIPITVLGSSEQAFKTLTEGREPLREYKVQSGDSYWSIAERNHMSVDELKLINGAVNNNLSVGQILRLNIPKPLLSVRTTVSAIDYEAIPFDTVYQENNQINKGQSQVRSAGIDGTLEIKYEIAHINGFAVEKKVMSATMIADPVDKVVENGTKAVQAAVSSVVPTLTASRGDAGETRGGSLSWPIRNTINSPFGNRSRGFHSGIDIQARTGDPVYSSGAGKVISASYFAGYGNQVTIDHGDGLATMYAHLSEINVTVGQEVGLQELVGLAGSTGRTTGPHLHFEVRINGSPVNPVSYLQ